MVFCHTTALEGGLQGFLGGTFLYLLILGHVLCRYLDTDLNPVPKLFGEPVLFPVLGHTPRHLLTEHLAGKQINHFLIENNLLLLTLLDIFSLIHADLTVIFLHLVFLLSLLTNLFDRLPSILSVEEDDSTNAAPEENKQDHDEAGYEEENIMLFQRCGVFFTI